KWYRILRLQKWPDMGGIEVFRQPRDSSVADVDHKTGGHAERLAVAQRAGEDVLLHKAAVESVTRNDGVFAVLQPLIDPTEHAHVLVDALLLAVVVVPDARVRRVAG